jgi:hypothetical protein
LAVHDHWNAHGTTISTPASRKSSNSIMTTSFVRTRRQVAVIVADIGFQPHIGDFRAWKDHDAQPSLSSRNRK